MCGMLSRVWLQHFETFHRPSVLEEWQTAQWFVFHGLLRSKGAQKPGTGDVGSVQHVLTDVSWATSLFVWCLRDLQGIISDIWLSALYHISEPLAWPTGCPKQFAVAHWSTVTGEAHLWNVASLAQSLCSTGPTTCKPSTICHRRGIVHALGAFIRQPKLTLHTH